jgi:hypothetical protein
VGQAVRIPRIEGTRPALQHQRFDQAVAEGDDAVGAAGEVVVVGGDEGRGALVADEAGKGLEHLVAGGRVEIAGGFVGEDDARIVGGGAGDGDALLFAAGELGRTMGAAPADAEEVEQLVGALVGLRLALAGDELGNGDILARGELGQEVVELVDVADGGAAQQRAAALIAAVGVPTISTSPCCGRSRRPPMWSSVDLPAPDGATMATSSPPLTVRSAASSTRTWVGPSP